MFYTRNKHYNSWSQVLYIQLTRHSLISISRPWNHKIIPVIIFYSLKSQDISWYEVFIVELTRYFMIACLFWVFHKIPPDVLMFSMNSKMFHDPMFFSRNSQDFNWSHVFFQWTHKIFPDLFTKNKQYNSCSRVQNIQLTRFSLISISRPWSHKILPEIIFYSLKSPDISWSYVSSGEPKRYLLIWSFYRWTHKIFHDPLFISMELTRFLLISCYFFNELTT